MSGHLLMFSVGPVAEFIDSSRRTRDLFFSSQHVARMARAAAFRIQAEFEAELIVPAVPSGADKDQVPVSDEVLAIIPEGKDPRSAADVAKEAAHNIWKEAADNTRALLAKKRWDIGVEDPRWTAQRDSDLVEFFAAWSPLGKDYNVSRQKLENLFRARETLTDFSPNPLSAGVPKSSLDGRRETVLGPGASHERARFQAGINRAEQLDLPGVVKRVGSGRFPPVSRIALDSWIGWAEHDHPEEVTKLLERMRELSALGLVSKVEHPPIYGSFPYDAELLLESRARTIANGKSRQLDALEPEEKKVAARLADSILLLLKKIGRTPFPYVATICADGDGMGERTRDCSSAEQHVNFGRSLSLFASKVPEIVEGHRGVVVYAGGDDLLAFSPVDQAIGCAEELHSEFLRQVGGELSVGIAITHILTPMAGTMVKHAGEALNGIAKQRKGALAVLLEKRSGSPTNVCLSWAADPAKRFGRWIELLESELIPEGLSRDLYRMAGEYAGVDAFDKGDSLRKEVGRLLGKKRPKAGRLAEENRDFIINLVSDVSSLAALANEMIIAQNFHAAHLR
ncbi:MAG: type III-B CRISPR-associated protein Cas10/Cmr2 [Candidatus Eisenbacteria bacterium]